MITIDLADSQRLNKMSQLHIDIAKACIKEAPNEACGVIDGSKVIALKNISEEPTESFVISGHDYLKYLPKVIYHSHPKGDYSFSDQDINVAANMELTSYLYVVEKDRIEKYNLLSGVEVYENILGQ